MLMGQVLYPLTVQERIACRVRSFTSLLGTSVLLQLFPRTWEVLYAYPEEFWPELASVSIFRR